MAQTLATGLEAPWSVVRDGDDGLLVSERDSGRILEVRTTQPDRDPRVVGTVAGIEHGGEGGLLGLAVRGQELYAYSTGTDGNRVQRFALSGEAGARRLGPPVSVIDRLPSAFTHNAGRIAFGPDGKLYVPVGDAGAPEQVQEPRSLYGKILRLNPDGSVPADNPAPGSPVYSMGHRNVQGLAWDKGGTMYAAEFGQNTWDELNVIEPGQNYGWPETEGRAGRAGFVDPVAQWPTSEASPSGIAVVGKDVWIAGLGGERIIGVPLVGHSAREAGRTVFDGVGRVRDVVADGSGGAWVLTNNTDGRGTPAEGDDRLLRLRPPAG